MAPLLKDGILKQPGPNGLDYGIAIPGVDYALPGSGGGGITELTGDVLAGPGTGSQPATLEASGVIAGSYGDATHVPQLTIDAKGRTTAAANIAIVQSANYVVMSNGDSPPTPMDNGNGDFLYIGYTP